MDYTDPYEEEQIAWLGVVLGKEVTPKALLGLLIIGPRMVNNFGHQRITELEHIFKTESSEGRKSLRLSLEYLARTFNSVDDFAARYPISIIPPRPAYPMLRIIGIDKLADKVYRVFDSRLIVRSTGENLKDYLVRTGRMPAVPRIAVPVRRTKPRVHWCSYFAYDSPAATAEALQILPGWSDCKLRVNLLTKNIGSCAYLAYNGDRPSADNDFLEFSGYFTEPLAQDHPPLAGGGLQIAVTGAPAIAAAELWNEKTRRWDVFYERAIKASGE